MRTLAQALVGLALLGPGAAAAHEILHTVERGRAVAVKVFEDDGEPLAGARYEVYAPADPAVAYGKGVTDRSGYLAFVPDADGPWRVKVVEATGHGLDTTIEVTGSAPPVSRGPGTAGFVLRPLVGLAALALMFGALVVVARRRRRPTAP
jgi:nickel transport protein